MMDSQYIDRVLASSDEDLAVLYGAQLLATQLKQALRALRGTANAAADYRKAVMDTLPEAQAIGMHVLRAEAEGRKTVRVADLVERGRGKAAA